MITRWRMARLAELLDAEIRLTRERPYTDKSVGSYTVEARWNRQWIPLTQRASSISEAFRRARVWDRQYKAQTRAEAPEEAQCESG